MTSGNARYNGTRPNNLWAITSYFNPVGYRTRRENFRHFRDRLGVKLIAVELGYRDNFDLAAGDADILIQIDGGDVLWQKERLINLALGKLPDDCSKVAWVDCDIIFDRPDWAAKVEAILDRVPLAQTFRHVRNLPPGTLPEAVAGMELPTRRSLIDAFNSGVPLEVCLNELPSDGAIAYKMARGFAWAARRDLLDRHGLYDACIIGGGDRALAYAIFGWFDAAVRHFHMSEIETRRFMAWAVPFAEAVGGAVDSIDADIFHLWHGDMRRRGSGSRQAGLRRFAFNPNDDIAVSETGAWRWNTDKPDMHAFMQSYFESRMEDG